MRKLISSPVRSKDPLQCRKWMETTAHCMSLPLHQADARCKKSVCMVLDASIICLLLMIIARVSVYNGHLMAGLLWTDSCRCKVLNKIPGVEECCRIIQSTAAQSVPLDQRVEVSSRLYCPHNPLTPFTAFYLGIGGRLVSTDGWTFWTRRLNQFFAQCVRRRILCNSESSETYAGSKLAVVLGGLGHFQWDWETWGILATHIPVCRNETPSIMCRMF